MTAVQTLADLKPGDEVAEVSWRHRDGTDVITFCRISKIKKVTPTQIVLNRPSAHPGASCAFLGVAESH